MANVIINEKHLTDIAHAIRAKNGKETQYRPQDMAEAINDLKWLNSDGIVIDTPLDDYRMFASNAWNRYIPYVRFEGDGCLLNGEYLFFYNNTLEEMPYELVFGTNCHLDSAFYHAEKIKNLPIMRSIDGSPVKNMFYYTFFGCHSLENIALSDYEIKLRSNELYFSGAFAECYRLQGILDFNDCIINFSADNINSIYMHNIFSQCHHLKEILNLPLFSNNLSGGFVIDALCGSNCLLSKLTFMMNEDGTNKDLYFNSSSYNSAFINLQYNVGYCYSTYSYEGWNIEELIQKGFDRELYVNDDASYQALKNNPEWWSLKPEYSHYNRISAVETINSLPNFIPSGTQTAIIQFKGVSGALTDGGAINTMTEEEIAVATAKGWTVAFV